MVFNTTHAAMQFCNGQHWIALGGGGESGLQDGAEGSWEEVDLEDTAPFDIECKYRFRRATSVHYARSVSADTLLFDAAIAEFKFGAIESSSKDQFWYRGDGATGTTSGTPAAIDEMQRKCLIDTEPDAIAFNDVTGAAVNTVVLSNVVTIAGINQSVAVSVAGDGSPEISIGGGAWGTSGNITNGQTLGVRTTSSVTASTAVIAMVTVGGVTDTWSVTTAAAPADTTPNAFTFTDVANAALSTLTTSANVTIAGISASTPVSVTGAGAEISINGGAWGTSGNITNGQTLAVRTTSSGLFNTATTATVDVGGVTDTWSVTTMADTTSPVWTTAAGTIATINTAAALSANVVGTDNSGNVSYLKTGGDSWISVSGTGAVTGTAPGSAATYSVTVRLSDVAGNFVDRTFSVVVNAPATGCTWTVASAAEANSWTSVAHGAGKFIAVATGGTNRMMTSSDGVSWSPVSGIAAHWWTSVIYANSKFVAVSGGSTMSSSDGVTWTTPVTAPQGSFEAVAYGNGKYVAVGYGNTSSAYHAMTSTDGVSWTGNTFMAGKQWEAIAFGNGRFVAVAGDGSSEAAMTSTDGVNWSLGSLTGSFDGVTFANGVFYTSSGSTLYSSTDGLTWASQAVPTAARHGAWLGAIYAGGRIMGVGQGISTTWSGSVTSEDGSDWVKGTVPQNTNTWTSVAYGGGKYVAVASSGTNRVMWTDCGDAPPADTTPDAFTITDVTGAALSTQTTSANLTISGINGPASVTATNGATFSINGGAFGTTGTITNGQTLAIRMISSAVLSTAVTSSVTVGGVSDTWSVTTRAGNGCSVASGTTWTVSGQTCTVPSGVSIGHGASGTATDATAPTEGTASWSCNDGTATADGGATCAVQVPVCENSIISASHDQGCAIRADGVLMCWGNDPVGDGTTTTRRTPVPIGSGTFKSVNMGNSHTCAVKSDNSGWCWGYGGDGRLGNNSNSDQLSPGGLTGGGSWNMISAGYEHSCGIKTDGSAWCWGEGGSGRLGAGNTTDTKVPGAVIGGGSYRWITAGRNASCGIRTDDTLWCWGGWGFGSTPVQVAGSWKHIVASSNFDVGESENHICGIKADGSAWCMGTNVEGSSKFGALGDGTTVLSSNSFVQVSGGGSWKWLSVGYASTNGIKADGSGWTWGGSYLGDGTSNSSNVPVLLPGGGSWVATSTASDNGCGIKDDGTGWCWGRDLFGSLGNGGTADNPTPAPISGGFQWKTSCN